METLVANTLTAEERQTLLSELLKSRDGVLRQAADLSQEQATFKPAPDVWSVAENVEHIAIVEEFSALRIRAMHRAELADPARDGRALEALVRSAVIQRENKVKTPPAADPTGTEPLAAGIDRFLKARERTVALLDEPHCFRGRVQAHPVLPPMDGYQWMLAFAGHAVRHTLQIRELKAHPAFPKA